MKIQKMIQSLTSAIEKLESYNERKYEIWEISTQIQNALELWESYQSDTRDDITQTLVDFRENMDSYLEYYEEGEPESLRFLTNSLNNIIGRLEDLDRSNSESDSISEEDDDTEDAYSEDKNHVYQLDKHFECYEDEKQAAEKNWKRVAKVEERFFDIDRNKKKSTHTLMQTFFNNRKKQSAKPIKSDDLSGRALVTADSAAVKKSLPKSDKVKITSGDDIVKHLKWQRKPGRRIAWNREKVQRGVTEINYQFQPTPGNLGNFMMSGVGRYGTDKKDILDVVDDLTDRKPEFERKFAKILIEFNRDGKPITDQKLYDEGFALYKNDKDRARHMRQLNRIAYLVDIKETSRRRFPGMKNTMHGSQAVTELPFGIAVAQTLRLLADGHLRMADVFDKDADYGVFAGTEILNDRNLPKTTAKFERVFALYNKVYAERYCKYDGTVIPTREGLHQDLLEVFGGASESSGEEYETSSEEADPPRRQP